MSFLDRWHHRLRARFQSEAVRRERDAEVDFHLSLDTMHAEQRGLSSDAAHEDARRRFGNLATTKEDARAVSRSGFLDTLWQDARYAVRTLRKSPAYSVGAGLTLAIGIGASTAVFSVADAVWLRALPYPESTNIYTALEQNPSGGQRTPSYLAFRDWLADSATLQAAIDHAAFIRGERTWLDGPNGSEGAIVGRVSPDFFKVMRTPPLMGRTFLPTEEAHDGARVAVISFDAWRRYFGSDAAILGKTVSLDSVPTTIVGVMPRGFTYPQWTSGRVGATSVWAPVAHIEATDAALMKRGDHADSRVVLRVSANTDSARAARALSAIVARISGRYPDEAKNWTQAALLSVRDATVGPVRPLIRTLAGAVALMLLLACANVANLAFVRGTARARELAVRSSLGASRARIVRQLLTEAVGLAALGFAGGVVLAGFAIAAARSLAATQMAGVEHLGLSVEMLAFAAVVSFAAAIAASLFPALRATRATSDTAIRAGAQSATGARGDNHTRNGLVVVQLALALVLLVGTGLLVRSIQNIEAVSLGYEPDGVVASAVSPPAKYATASDALALYQSILDRLRSAPGVTDAAFINHAPGGFGGMITNVSVAGHDPASNDGNTFTPYYRTVSESYLRTMRMQMVRGRWFDAADMRSGNAFVLNETLARLMFANADPIGKQIVALRAARPRADFGRPIHGTVIGVTRDIRAQGPELPPVDEIFVPFTVETWHWGTIVVRGDDVARAVTTTREALLAIDPGIPEARASGDFNGATSLRARVASGLSQRQLALTALGAFALAALILAAVGLYAVISYGVSRRTRELGVRLALGASPGTIVRMVLTQGTALAALGVAVGCASAYGATRVLRSLLFETPLTHVPTYLTTVAILVASAALACYLPAHRAARLSPTEAIKGE